VGFNSFNLGEVSLEIWADNMKLRRGRLGLLIKKRVQNNSWRKYVVPEQLCTHPTHCFQQRTAMMQCARRA